ncbi:UNVERIFIED_CONTAM: hypothetical protein FKN15_056692 [Acipenser sinensis]
MLFNFHSENTKIDIFKYVIYGVAAAFFVYGILLMVEGFFTTGAIKDLYGDFKITTCGRCVSCWYVIYGVAAAFFVYGILLMVEGFFTTGAIKDLYGDFKITTCGRCVSCWFIMLTYIFMLAWLGVTAFTSLPVFMYFNIWTICQNTTIVEGANLCLDLRQFGIVTIGEEKKICTGSENFYKMCESNELDLTFHLFIVALAGAGAAVIAMIHYLMVLSANWAYVKDACRMQKYEDIKSKEEQELHDIHSTRSKERLNAYT